MSGSDSIYCISALGTLPRVAADRASCTRPPCCRPVHPLPRGEREPGLRRWYPPPVLRLCRGLACAGVWPVLSYFVVLTPGRRSLRYRCCGHSYRSIFRVERYFSRTRST